MIAIPAIDIRDGACVQLVGGAYDEERIRITDPVAAARRWRELGFAWLHVVDLDAATGRGDNGDAVADILADVADVSTQVGGGVRSHRRVRELLDAGVARIVTGTRALEDLPWLRELASKHPGRIVVAVDVRDSRPVVRGWSTMMQRDVDEVLASLHDLPLAALLVTAVHVEGQLGGPDVPLVRRVVNAAAHPVIAAGGVTTLDDLRALEDAGAWGAVVGMALYTGDMDAASCAAEFGGEP